MLPAPRVCSGNPTPESKSMPAGPSPDQPRSEGSQVLKKGAWEEEVEGCTHLGKEPPDSQCCGHVAAKEGSGVLGAGPPGGGTEPAPAAKDKEVTQNAASLPVGLAL